MKITVLGSGSVCHVLDGCLTEPGYDVVCFAVYRRNPFGPVDIGAFGIEYYGTGRVSSSYRC